MPNAEGQINCRPELVLDGNRMKKLWEDPELYKRVPIFEPLRASVEKLYRDMEKKGYFRPQICPKCHVKRLTEIFRQVHDKFLQRLLDVCRTGDKTAVQSFRTFLEEKHGARGKLVVAYCRTQDKKTFRLEF